MKSTLYKKSKNGKLQMWQIETEDNRFRTTEGYLDGKQTSTEWTSCQGKRIGSTNETSPQEQSIKEAEARVRKQLDKGWTEDINSVDEAAMKISPQLAHKLEENWDYALKLKHIALQAKLDGARQIGEENGLFTRTGKPIYSAPHIWKEVSILLKGFKGAVKLDGENYNHELHDDFNEIISIFKKQKPTEEDLLKSKQLAQYHIYDVDVEETSFAARYIALKMLLESAHPFEKLYLHLVPTTFIDNSDGHVTKEMLQEYRDKFIEMGYEGVMVRNADSFYQNHRTKDLLKWKEFQDAEFELINIEEGRGNRAGMAAKVYCRDSRGEEFSAGLKGKVDYCKQLLKDKDQYIGKMVTIRYQNLTSDRQVPRFGKMLIVRDYE